MNEKFKPVTVITMGDPVGIGLEIAVGTMLNEEIHECCRPLVIGNITVLNRVAKISGKGLGHNRIKDPSEALSQYGTVDVLETGGYDTDSVRQGKIQELADRMSADQIMRSIELGMNHKIDAVSTAPIHKKATKLAGVKQSRHTEIYQDETYSPYALTMFSYHRLRMFFVGRHMSLVDVYGYTTKERILEFVENINKELGKMGITKPLIAVATLNPYGGDNGLLGTEETEQPIPTVEAAGVRGISAVGPVPADSVLHIDKSGKYDTILFLYHDQDHIACKTLDSEKSVILAFGLPFIRSSVDHGTAFDIAGKGIVGSVSLIESTRVVAKYVALVHKKADQ